MFNNIDNATKTPRGKVMAGGILLAVGCFLLLKQFDIDIIPDSIDLWPLWLIFWGLVIGARSNFQKSSAIVLIGLGGIFMLTENLHNVGGFVWPVAIIGLGLWIISKRGSHHNPAAVNSDYWDSKYQATPADKPLANFGDADYDSANVPPVDPLNPGSTNVPPHSYDDILNATAIFGGVNKTIFSKNFRGGDITNIFGGTELDFTQADIHGRVVIDITQVFGGTKIIVPVNWQVVPDLAAVFAAVDDKRIKNPSAINHNKVLVLKGVSLFAGVDIRSY
ncbi:LiaF transmembrane domain-containing protein [Mucilaginibacter glaciei]|uniref:Cell wall-active antibiotic response 4TMS protein YvqF n=1 Tax=Mucilaginibacter glaciei TaxID=2772109 RepID=A0A926S2H6_9SPHI|nr:DUF5668 domain-containing protein [Mucilaginibacter glaciei]MBD1393204.1 hypothetical protein [Mucilaginibacter glaciei]